MRSPPIDIKFPKDLIPFVRGMYAPGLEAELRRKQLSFLMDRLLERGALVADTPRRQGERGRKQARNHLLRKCARMTDNLAFGPFTRKYNFLTELLFSPPPKFSKKLVHFIKRWQKKKTK